MAQLKSLPSHPCTTTSARSLHSTEHVLFNRFWKANPCSYKELRPRTSVDATKLHVVKAVLRSDTDVEVSEAKKGSGLRGKLNKVVLAYSGGLDTSVIVPWLRENYGCDVVCFTADVGQGIKELDGLEAKAKASGASQLVVKDLKEEFVKDYVFPCLRAGAIYERKYLLGTSMARPVIAKAMVDVAKEVGADAISHGCTGKGNDQVRFELTFFAMNPKLNLVAPWREWDITCREDAIEYAKKHNVPVPVTKKSIYSRDRNLWHLSHEAPVKGLSSSSSAIHFQRSATFPARASRNALNGPLNFNPLHLTSGSVTDDEMIRADKLAYHRFLLGQLALVKGSTSSSSSSASYNPFRLRRQSRTYDEEHEVRKLSLGLERDLRHGRNEEDRAITILKKLVDFYRTGADLFFSANRETPNTGLPVSAPAQDSKNALVTFTTFLWGVLDIPSTIRPVLIFLFAGLLKGLSGDSISTFEFKSGITTKASESTLTLGEAIFAYESEIIQVVLYYICYSLSWMLILPLHHGMVIVLGILLIFAPMLFLPNLVRKASSTGVRVALGSSFNMSLTSFTLTAAFGFFLIFGLVAWLVLYFIWIFVRGRTPARGQDNEERRALWRLASLFDL